MPLSHVCMPVLFAWFLAAVGTWAAWHVYEVREMLVAALAATLAGTVLAWLLRRTRWWWQCLAVLATYVLVTTLISVRDLMQQPDAALGHLSRIVTAPVTGWKDILTLDLPLGSYQAVLAPFVMVMLSSSYGALVMAWRGQKTSAYAPVVALTMPAFGLLFGSSVTNTTTQMVIGACTFGGALGWLIWRAVSTRHVSLREAQGSTTTPTSNRSIALVRAASAGAIVVIAMIVGFGVTPTLLTGQTRDVPRANVHPEIEIDRALSPLSTFRNYRGDELLNTTLLSVTAPHIVNRVRFVTLPEFDGVAMRPSVTAAGSEGTEFRRVPSVITREQDDPVSVTVTIDAYDEIWVPLAGDLVSVEFEGQHRSALSDGFFYQRASQSGVQLSNRGFIPGDRVATEVLPIDSDALAAFQPSRSGPSVPDRLVPQSLTTWMNEQGVTLSGQGLMTLVDRLRERSFLSHSIVNDATAAGWMEAFGVSTFEPSRAGHTTARIDRLFRDLNSRQLEVGPEADDDDLVAAVGDDEQFAVAGFLIADAMGFEARVALGVKLLDDATGVAACELGVCTGANVTAWLEVKDAATGEWGALDVTPQSEVPPHAETTHTSEPQHPTQVDSQHADIVPPPEAAPNEGGTPPNDTDESQGLWQSLWPIVRWAGIGLLALVCLATPFVIVVALKYWNRRTRFTAERPRHRLVGGWDEFVDRAVDHGAPYPERETRREYAKLVQGDPEFAMILADLADRAAFAPFPITDEEAHDYWQLVGEAHEGMQYSASRWGRLRSRFSLRSLRAALRRESAQESARL